MEPIYNLMNELRGLKETKGLIEHVLKQETKKLEETEADISRYENAIKLIKGE